MGQVIAGRFELAEHIASGGSGSIWAAWDRRRGQWCAAKVLRHKDSGELLRFVREQGIQLDHPYLATPYGWAAEDEDVAISMPLVAGGTLETALSDHGAFSSALAARLLLQLLQALDHVHHAGWIHRDVKPANILLEPTGEGMPHLRLGDFGIAVRQDDPRFTSHGWVNGTPGYLAPEVLDLAAPDPAQDLYAAGVVALRMLDPTLRGERDLAAAVLDPRRALARIEGVDPRLASVVAELLDEDPADRTAAARRAPGTLDVLAGPQTAAGGYLTAAGEPFVVFRQVEPEHAGTDDVPVPAGRGRAAGRVPGPATDSGPTTDSGVTPADGPVLEPSRTAGPAARVPAPPDRTPRVAGSGDGPVPPDAPAPGAGGRLGSVLPWVLVLVGAVALVAAAVLLWPPGGDAGTDAEPGGASSPASATTAATTGTAAGSPVPSGTGAASEADPSGNGEPSDGGSSAATRPPARTADASPGHSGPSSGAPVITSSVRAGDRCTALERGMVVTGADGDRLVCAEDEGTLAWQGRD